MQESSVLGLHNAGTQVHSMEGNQTAGLWQLKIGTRKNKGKCKFLDILNIMINAYKSTQ